MIYDDIIEAYRKRDIKEAITAGAKIASRNGQDLTTSKSRKSRAEELEYGMREIKALGLEDYCSVLQI